MQSDKWIKDLAPDTAVEDAAWRVLTIRFDSVRRSLDDVLGDERGAEAVHQLRVATRRAGAALRLFSDCVPGKALKKARSRLKELRQAAGAVRDGDVQLARLKQAAKKFERKDMPAIDLLIGYTLAQLDPANEELSSEAAKFLKRFDKLSAQVIGEIEPTNKTARLAELARDSLTPQLSQFDRALAKVSPELDDLHEARIIGKRLRYTTEIIAGCYPSQVRDEVYPALVELQEILGDINDHAVSAELLGKLHEQLPTSLRKRAKRYRSTLERLVKQHKAAITESLPRFDDWRDHWQTRRAELETLLQTDAASEPNEPTSESENVPAEQIAANSIQKPTI